MWTIYLVVEEVPTTPACTWWNRPEEDPSSGKLESTQPSRTSVKSAQGFLVSSQSCVSTPTHYSSELLLRRHQELLNDLTTGLIMANNNSRKDVDIMMAT